MSSLLVKSEIIYDPDFMCGRFYDIRDLDDITSRFRVDRSPSLTLPIRYNITPTQIVGSRIEHRSCPGWRGGSTTFFDFVISDSIAVNKDAQ